MTEKHRIAAALRGERRTALMAEKITRAMQEIEMAMQRNAGVYPLNGGAVSVAELARRADISESSLYKKQPANISLRLQVLAWLEKLKGQDDINRAAVKKTAMQRADEWKEKHDALMQRHIRTELELQSLEAQIQVLQQLNDDLTDAIRRRDKQKVSPLKATSR